MSCFHRHNESVMIHMKRKIPAIDMEKTGLHMKRIMIARGLKVKDIQDYLQLSTPQGIYHWFEGKSMPSLDNLYALSELFHMPIDMLLIGDKRESFGTYLMGYEKRLYVYYDSLVSIIAA